MSLKHTPTPWKLGNVGLIAHTICREDGTAIVSAWANDDNNQTANAEFIVRACNAHDDLVAELMQAHTELEEAAKLLASSGLRGVASLYTAAAARVAAAISKAEGR